MSYDRVYLKQFGIWFFKKSAGNYVVFRRAIGEPFDRIKLGMCIFCPRRQWIFVPENRALGTNGIGFTRFAAINDCLHLVPPSGEDKK